MSIWTNQDTERVLRETPAGTQQKVSLAAARNEYESFQILVRADEPLTITNIKVDKLTGPKGAVIPAAGARLYRQHQLELTEPSFRNDGFKAGWYPDALIPFRPTTNQVSKRARLRAVPFSLPANETHGFWVDIYVPIDAKSGIYHGVYQVEIDDRRSVNVPVDLVVWDFALPSVPTMKTAFGAPAQRMRNYYREGLSANWGKEPENWDAIEAQCAEEVSRHHINATPPSGTITPLLQNDGSWRIPLEQIRILRKFIDNYHINAIQVPHPRRIIKDPDEEKDKLYAWLKAFDIASSELNRSSIVFFMYLKDEPKNEPDYRYVQKWGRVIREAKSIVKVLVVEQTRTQNESWGTLYGAVDIWCPAFFLHDEETAAQRRVLGESVWCYTALSQQKETPWWFIDMPLLNYRVPAWIAWRYNMRGLLYWGGMAHWNDVADPWIDPRTHKAGEKRNRVYNGEGSLTYPARPVGYEGIVPSIRLKVLRDGIEDYEYLAILDRKGLGWEARKVVLPLAESWFKWEKDPAAFREARAKLAEMILRAK